MRMILPAEYEMMTWLGRGPQETYADRKTGALIGIYCQEILYVQAGGANMEEIIRMQNNLLLIRRTVGWTAEEFGEKIGVTRQTINNIESGRNKLTKTQYIAMRSVLDAEMAQAPEDTEMLKVLLDVLVDHPKNYSFENRDELLSKANMMAPSILAGTTTRADVSKEWIKAAGVIVGGTALLGPLGLGTGIAAINAWLVKTFASSKKKPTLKEKKDG